MNCAYCKKPFEFGDEVIEDGGKIYHDDCWIAEIDPPLKFIDKPGISRGHRR